MANDFNETRRLLVPRREAAHLLGVSERKLFDLTKDGVVPSIRLGDRGVRYSVKSLEQFIEQRLTPSA